MSFLFNFLMWYQSWSFLWNKHSPSVSTQQSPNGTSTVAETKFFIKKKLFPWKSSNFDEIFPARKQKPNLSFKGLTQCLLFKREKGSGEEASGCGFGRKEVLPINGGNKNRGKKVQIPRHSRRIWYPLHPVLCTSVVHISVFHRRGSCISVGSCYMKSFV